MGKDETIKQLREEVESLRRQLEHYQQIAATYRAHLGDVKANTILLSMPRPRRSRDRDDGDWSKALALVTGPKKGGVNEPPRGQRPPPPPPQRRSS